MKNPIFVWAALILIFLGFVVVLAQEPSGNPPGQTVYDPASGAYTVPQGGTSQLKIDVTVLNTLTTGSVNSFNSYDLTVGADQRNVILGGKTFTYVPSGSEIINDNGVIQIKSPPNNIVAYNGASYSSGSQTLTFQQDGSITLAQGQSYEKDNVVVNGPATIDQTKNQIMLSQGGVYSKDRKTVVVTGPATIGIRSIDKTYTYMELSKGATYVDNSKDLKITAVADMTDIYEGALSISQLDFDAQAKTKNGVLIAGTNIRGEGYYTIEIGKILINGQGANNPVSNAKGTEPIPDSSFTFTWVKGVGDVSTYQITPGVQSQLMTGATGDIEAAYGLSKVAYLSKTVSDTSAQTGVSTYLRTGGAIGWLPEAQQTPESPPKSIGLTQVSGLSTESFPPDGTAWKDSNGLQWTYNNNPLIGSPRWEKTGLTFTRGGGWLDNNGNLHQK